MTDTKITLDDLEKWFGQKMPLPVAKLLWEAPAHFTAGDIRWATRLMRDLLFDMTRQRDDLAAEVMRLLHVQTLEAIQSGIDGALAEGAKP